MEFQKIIVNEDIFYWTWKDADYLPYAWLEKKDLKTLPIPFFIISIHPDCSVGFKSEENDELTNIIQLPDSFDKLNLDNDLRKDLKRVEKKNENIRLVYNEKDALDKSKRWFLEQWEEDKEEFKRRLELWKEKCYTISAYLGDELIAVHIAMKEKDTIYYFGCWWNREYKSLSTPTFLLKKDIEKAIEDGMKYYDLEIGDEPYKKKWGVIEIPTKTYAILTKELAERWNVKNYVKIATTIHNPTRI
ncbi:MAG: GNAT family N-acetyltransferase [Nanoarchaeota archaeon]